MTGKAGTSDKAGLYFLFEAVDIFGQRKRAGTFLKFRGKSLQLRSCPFSSPEARAQMPFALFMFQNSIIQDVCRLHSGERKIQVCFGKKSNTLLLFFFLGSEARDSQLFTT
jgi:hypothetical protein